MSRTNPQPNFRPSRSLPILAGLSATVVACLGSTGDRAIATVPPESNPVPLAEADREVSVLHVNPNIGNDRSGDGSDRAPYQTITHALGMAGSNIVIVLAPGTYSTQTGETFPLELVPNVTIQGNPNNRGQDTIIRGGGSYLSPTATRQNIAILAADGAGLTGVTVTNPNPRGYGLWVESSAPVVAKNTLAGSQHDGISVNGNSQPDIRDNYFTRNGASGLSIFGTSTAQVQGNTFERTGFGVNVAGEAAPVLIDNEIRRNKDGVVVQGNGRPILRDNRIQWNERDGVVAIGEALPDLGTASEPGNNTIRANGRYDLHNAVSQQIIPAFGNQLSRDRIEGRVDLAGKVDPRNAPVARRREPLDRAALLRRPSQPQRRSQRQQSSQDNEAIEIPVPPPESNQEASNSRGNLSPPPSQRSFASSSPPPQPIRPREPDNRQPSSVTERVPNLGSLPVPDSNIPVGNGGSLPTVTLDPNRGEGPPPPPDRAEALGLRYRVIVNTDSGREQSKVRSLVPGSFRTRLNGRVVMQAGAFRERSRAMQLLELLQNNDLDAKMEEIQ